MALLLPGGDPKKKMETAELPVATDSLAFAKKQMDKYWALTHEGTKPFDASDKTVKAATNPELQKAVKYLEGHINKYREAADALHAQKKAANPEFPGLSARDLDAVTEGKGAEYLKHVQEYNRYRKMTNKGKTALGEKDMRSQLIGPSSFGGPSTSQELLYYNPEAGASTLVKRSSNIPMVTR